MSTSKRFIWQFDLDMQNPIQFPLQSYEKEPISWEARYFWHEDEIITIHGLTSDFLKPSNYRFKKTHDTYYILPHRTHNLKKRHGKLFYKPLIAERNGLFGFEKKIALDAQSQKNLHLPALTELIDATRIQVKKEVLLHTFKTRPAVKMEIARLAVENQIYMTFCLEANSYSLVDQLRSRLIRDRKTCQYVHWIKNILKYDH